jgi:hypothetical protein
MIQKKDDDSAGSRNLIYCLLIQAEAQVSMSSRSNDDDDDDRYWHDAKMC